MRRVLIHLQPAHHTMVSQVFGHPRFRNAQMFRQSRPDRFPFSSRSTANQIGNRHAQRLAGLNIIVGGQVRVREDPNAGPSRGLVGSVQRRRSRGEQAPEIHLELRQARGQSGIAVATTQAGSSRYFGCRFSGNGFLGTRRAFFRGRSANRRTDCGSDIPGCGMLWLSPGRTRVSSATASATLATGLWRSVCWSFRRRFAFSWRGTGNRSHLIFCRGVFGDRFCGSCFC